MMINKLDTTNFSDAELAAKAAAEAVGNLQALLISSKTVATRNWVGEGREAFNSLFYVIEQQMKDISDEFWAMYEALIGAEGVYLEADQAVATYINSVSNETAS